MKFFNFFKKDLTIVTDTTSKSKMELVIDLFCDKLRSSNLTSTILTKNVVLLNEYEIEFEFNIVESAHNHPYLIDIHVMATNLDSFPESIYEAVAGIGKTVEERIDDALNRFFSIFFPTLIKAVSKKNFDFKFEATRDEKNNQYNAWFSKVQILNDNTTVLNDRTLFRLIEHDFVSRLNGQRTLNWIKFEIHKPENGGEFFVDCQFNNFRINSLIDEIKSFYQERFQDINTIAIKQWVFIENNTFSNHLNESLLEVQRQHCKSLMLKIEQMFENYFEYFDKPKQLQEKIAQQSTTTEEFLVFYHFLPNIVHRVLHPQIKNSSYFIISEGYGNESRSLYTDLLTYSMVATYVQKNLNKIIDRDVYKILFNSSEFKATNDAIGKGSKIENLVAMPYVIRMK